MWLAVEAKSLRVVAWGFSLSWASICLGESGTVLQTKGPLAVGYCCGSSVMGPLGFLLFLQVVTRQSHFWGSAPVGSLEAKTPWGSLCILQRLGPGAGVLSEESWGLRSSGTRLDFALAFCSDAHSRDKEGEVEDEAFCFIER